MKLGLAGFTSSFVREWLAADVGDGQACDGWAGLLARCVAADLPVDFVSWHIYAEDWAAIEAMAAGVRVRMDALGLSAAENHLTEWNYNPTVPIGDEKISFMGARRSKDWQKFEAAAAVANGSAGAAFVFGALARLQDSSVDVAHLYTGVSMPFGLFSGTGRPHTKYFGFEAFGRLACAGERVCVDIDEPESLSALAVVADGACLLGIASLSQGPRDVRVRVASPGPSTAADAQWLAGSGWQQLAGIRESDGGIVVPLPEAGVAMVTWPGQP